MFVRIKDYSNYKIDENGCVFSFFYNKKLKQRINFGYKIVSLYSLDKSKKQKYKRVHRLVAEAFIPNPKNKPDINHIDGDKKNNNIHNLEWCTAKENMEHAKRIGLIDSRSAENHYEATLRNNDIIEIRKLIKPPYYYGQLTEIARRFNVTRSCICKIKKNKTYNSVVD